MIDFSKVEFNKAISLNPINSQGIGKARNPFANSKYELVKLGEIKNIEIRKGQNITQKQAITGKIKVVAGGKDYAYLHNSFNRNENTITISASGANAGYVNFWKEKIFASDCTTINLPILETIRFIYYTLKYNQKYIMSLARGAAQPHVYPKDIENIKIPLPPLEIQTQIVAECESLESRCNAIEQSIKAYQELIKAILWHCGITTESTKDFDSILMSLAELESKLDFELLGKTKQDSKAFLQNLTNTLNTLQTPPKEGWERVRLGQVCEILIGGTPARNNSAYFQGDNLWVSIAEMNGQVITDTKEKISDEAIKKSNVKLIPKDTTLLSFKLSIGKTAIAGKDLYTNEAIAGLIPNDKNKLLDMFLFYIFKWQTIDLDLKGNNAFGKSLNSSILKEEVKIPLPPLEAQEKITQSIETIQSQISFLDSALPLLQSQKQEVLKKYLF